MSFVTALEAVRKLDKDIYAVTLPDETDIIFTLPSFKKASQYAQVLVIAGGNCSLETIVYNHIFEECVTDKYLAVHDENVKAGVPETIAKVILYLSGATDDFKEHTETLLDLHRSQTTSVLSIMKRTICQVFSAYKMSDVEELTFQEFVRVFVEAETVLLDQGIIEEGLKFKEPETAKPFSVESAIAADAKDYMRFDAPEGGPRSRLTDDVAYKAKQEEFRVRQQLRQRQGG